MRELTSIEMMEVSGGNKIVVEIIKWIAGSVAWDALKGDGEDMQPDFIVDAPSNSSAIRG